MSIFVSLLLFIFFMNGGLGLKEDANMSSCIEKERQALLDIKANLTNLNGYLDDWGSQEGKMDYCKWVGVTCSNDSTGHVIELDLGSWLESALILYNSRFTGKISLSLQSLNYLQYLNLSGINFQSSRLPKLFGTLSDLQRLDVSGANLSGPIPHQLANLSKLFYLDLSRNSLGGSIPFSFGDLASLTYLDLSQNQLGGLVPKSFGNYSSLVHLDLSHNLLNGSLPSFVGGCSLINISLAHNSLTGSMPDFTGCTSLKYLDLSNNFLSGNMPKSMGRLSNLENLVVSHNLLNGSIPEFIGCPSLRILDLSSNRLSGKTPKSVGQISNLKFLDFSSNSLEGVITEVHFLNLTQLLYLDFSFNSLALNLSFQESNIPFQLSTIRLQSCRLGPGFPVWIKSQKHFTHLDISNAGISGAAPDWFWNLPVELKFLNISSNEIEGMIPNLTSSFEGYPGLDLSNNHFEGRIPLFSHRLAALNLSGNRFSGTLAFLCEIYWFLTYLDLSNNSLSGSLPYCWLHFQEKLVVLNLSKNNLSGNIPSSLGVLSNLEALYLRENAFVGEVPMSLSNCKRLRFVDLGENKFVGAIPEWIGEQLSELYVLVLGSNRFNASLPSKVCWLSNLQVLDLSNNRLSGSIPRCFHNFTAMARKSTGDDITNHSYSYYVGHIPKSRIHVHCNMGIQCHQPQPHEDTQFSDNAWITWKGSERSFLRSGLHLLKSIDLSRNKLSGNLSYEITSLYELVSLNLSMNKLQGEIPKDMGRLKSLQSLDLSRNDFSGHIPSSLADLNFLSNLDLSNNNLSGKIPTGTQLQGFNCTFYSGNPQLYGPPLTPMCGFPHIDGKKDIQEDDQANSWKPYYTGMGAGFAVGFLGICGPLVSNRRCRYVFFALLIHMKDWIYVTVVVHIGKLERKFRG